MGKSRLADTSTLEAALIGLQHERERIEAKIKEIRLALESGARRITPAETVNKGP